MSLSRGILRGALPAPPFNSARTRFTYEYPLVRIPGALTRVRDVLLLVGRASRVFTPAEIVRAADGVLRASHQPPLQGAEAVAIVNYHTGPLGDGYTGLKRVAEHIQCEKVLDKMGAIAVAIARDRGFRLITGTDPLKSRAELLDIARAAILPLVMKPGDRAEAFVMQRLAEKRYVLLTAKCSAGA